MLISSKAELVSMIGVSQANQRIEVGMVGYEGMTGLGFVLGAERSTNEALVQSSGAAMRISTKALCDVMAISPTLIDTLLRYVRVFLVQTSQTALANGRGRLDERLARWCVDGTTASSMPAPPSRDFLACCWELHGPASPLPCMLEAKA